MSMRHGLFDFPKQGILCTLYYGISYQNIIVEVQVHSIFYLMLFGEIRTAASRVAK